VTGLEILVTEIFSHISAADYRETLSQPRENGVMPHSVARVKGQESPFLSCGHNHNTELVAATPFYIKRGVAA
jgi:hypothetical protein